MGFMDFLKGAGKVGLGFLTGGPVGAIASGVGQVLGAASGGKNDAKMAGAQIDQTGNNQLLSQYGLQQNAQMNQGQLDLQRKQFSEGAEASRMKRALVGSLLGNMQDFDISMPGIPKAQMSGGLKPSTLGQGGRDISAEMVARALSQIRSGDQFQGGNILPAPTLATPQKPSTGGFMDTAALIASLGGALGSAGKDYTKIQAPPSLPPLPPVLTNKPTDFFNLEQPDSFF
jgi:hypothetical protein